MNGFDIVTNGVWPEEIYTITLDNNIINPALNTLPAENLFRYENNWLLPINFISDFNYKNATVNFDTEGLLSIDTFSNTSFNWNVSAERHLYNTGYTFNTFSIDLLNGATLPDKYCVYGLYPERLVLKPISSPYKDINGDWVLTTEPVLSEVRKDSYLNKSHPDYDVIESHLELLKNNLTTKPIPANSNYSLVYNMSAARTRVDRPVINFSSTYNPSKFSIVLEPVPSTVVSKSVLRPYSTFIKYDVQYYAQDESRTYKLWNLGQNLPDLEVGILPTAKSSYIINEDKFLNTRTMAFQLVQIKEDGDPNIPLGDIKYCVLSGTFGLDDSNFTYFNKNTVKTNGTVVNAITGVSGTHIGVSYIADCPVIKNTNELWQDTLTETNNFELGVAIPTPSLSNITWKTKYPPHFYSYKANLIESSNPSKNLETYDLTFYLNSEILSAGYTQSGFTTSYCLSTYIHSNNHFISYGLSVGSTDEYIKFSPSVPSDTVFLESLTGYYGSDLSIPYLFDDPQWIPASACDLFVIEYPVITHGELDFTLRPSLSTLAGTIDSLYSTRINLAVGQQPENKGNSIFTITLLEKEDHIELDSAFLDNDAGWPGRDLLGSNISWDYNPKTPYTKIYAIDRFTGNYIRNITPNQSYLFNDSSYTIAVEGYGPNTTTIILSSQKYNETTTVQTNSALFDFFVEGALLVGESVPLNNINEIRTITLTAAVPYKGRVYELPESVQLDWTWTYNGTYSEDLTPISAYSTNTGNAYSFASNAFSVNALSSVDFKIRPAYSETVPQMNSVVLTCSLDGQSNLLEGSYEFEVDDFPSKNLLNSYFTVRYSDYRTIISYTKDQNNAVVTRKNDGTNDFEVEMVSDYSSLPNANIYWYIKYQEQGSSLIEYPPIVGSSLVPVDLTAVSVTYVSLCANDILIAGWTYPHSVESNCTFYILDPIEFESPLEFITFPTFYWGYADDKVTLLDSSNYTILTANEVFGGRKSYSQEFYLSANKDYFDRYNYHTHVGFYQFQKFGQANSYYDVLEVPYNTGELKDEEIYLALTAFNDTSYPEQNGITYLAPPSIGASYLQTFYYNNFSESDFYSSNIFRQPPLIKPYPKITNSFVCASTALDIDVDRNITVTQTMSSEIPNSPAKIVDGTVTYILSSFYWTAYKSVPAFDGTYSIFDLFAGNVVDFLTVNNSKTTTLVLYTSSDINALIPKTTFQNYPSYVGETDLWRIENQKSGLSDGKIIKTSSVTATPEIFISTTYTLTGDDVYIQYDAPTVVDPEFEVVAYATNFGEEDSTFISAFDETIKYSYNNVGTYFINISAFYKNNSIKEFVHENPIYVKSEWDSYDPNDLRFVEETILTYPNDKKDIEIQPNEWGDSDIFNTSILRLQENLDYLKSNTKSIDTLSPTVFFGWLGTNAENPYVGLRWFTKDYLSTYYSSPANASFDQINSFKNIIDVVETKNHIFVLHDTTKITVLSAGAFAPILTLENIDTLQDVISLPTSIEVSEDETSMFMADSSKNKIYRFELELNVTNPKFNYTVTLGGLGRDDEPNRFNSPSELIYANDMVYVLDYNNYCVKQFNSNLSWIHTYYSDILNEDNPVNIAIHPTADVLYVLTKSNMVYCYEQSNNTPITSFSLGQEITDIVKLVFDEVGDFLYVVTKTAIHKHSPSGYYFATLNLPQDNLTFYGGKQGSSNRSLLFFTNNAILKVQDILKTHQVGRGLPKYYWDKDQLIVERNEFTSDANYNRSLIRIAQNIKSFRNSINYKLAILTKQTPNALIKYLGAVPLKSDVLPIFHEKIENETIGVGVNELHTPQVINRELNIIMSAMNTLKDVFDIKELSVDENSECVEEFCWSWEGTSCYKLNFPIIKVCAINPITYQELDGLYEFSEVDSTTWENAISTCCKNVEPPV